MRQLCGILVCVFARAELRPVIGEVATAHVTTGVLGNRGGNKGAVALRFTLWRRTFTVIVSHFAAHQHNIDERNANYLSIVRRLKFKRHIVHPNLERLHRAGESARQRGAGGGERGVELEEESILSDTESEEDAGLGEEEVCVMTDAVPNAHALTTMCLTMAASMIFFFACCPSAPCVYALLMYHPRVCHIYRSSSTRRHFVQVRLCCGWGISIIDST